MVKNGQEYSCVIYERTLIQHNALAIFWKNWLYHLHNVYRQILTELRVHKMFFRSLFLYLETRDMYDICFMNSLWQYANRNETKKVVKSHLYFWRRAPNWLYELMFYFYNSFWVMIFSMGSFDYICVLFIVFKRFEKLCIPLLWWW